ncbi:MAG: ROK family protein [Candidatus Omnitrophica bacterium]|nr:ROK family protein [Candidatus Omnitrophota bacterium]MBU1996240.1 ROK family protein [Candidatus Omnitrophota bacterium]MBU4333243.1 ROK family protein [Candidatus Omnitrophota bacterium]
MKKYVIGVDVGGTNIKLGLINSLGKILSRSTLITCNCSQTKNKLIDSLAEAIKILLQNKGVNIDSVLGIGVGLPGLINYEQGIVTSLTNISGWRNVPLMSLLQKKINIPVYIDNDVNLIALGEWKFGAGKGYNNLLCMTLGTGVGSGIILNGELYRGEGFAAGELGHMPLNEKGPSCNCSGFGCFECYVGSSVLVAKAAKIFKNKNIKLEDVYDLANGGNIRAVQFWEETAAHVGNGLVGVVNLLNPRLIVIGGGISKSYKLMQKVIEDIVKKRAMKIQANMVKIVRAKLGDDAGLIGAQVLISASLEKRKK